MIISIDTGKAFDKVQHSFMIKAHNKICTEGTNLNTIKAIYENSTANIIINGEKQKAKIPTLSISIQHSTGSTSKSKQTRKRNKRHQNWKRRRKITCLQMT